MAQSKSQLPLLLGLTAAGGVGYYLYTAGGDPKVAEKQLEGMSPYLDQEPSNTANSIPSRYVQGLRESQGRATRPREGSTEDRRSMGIRDRCQDRQHCKNLSLESATTFSSTTATHRSTPSSSKLLIQDIVH